ncbi:hypothetical protein KIW84_030078 [Lathyrus oleraceus]|uniref:Uncharacterized protein n=1 Tax=Pisum sativum TaxID=3888 RepID=A0A9D4XM82_PEA|nr:hypothetical protein KIW84_030078 [Pisum sativum]
MLQQIKEKDALIEFLEHQVIDDPDDAWTSLLSQSSKFWKRRYDRLAKEKADKEAAYEREVKKLRAAYLLVVFDEKGLFKSGGFIHTGQDEDVAAILEEDAEDSDNFVIPGGICNNWVAVDVPTVIHKSELISKPIEHNDPTPSPNFEFPIFEAEEDDVEEIPDEITRLLEHEKKIIQSHLENP